MSNLKHKGIRPEHTVKQTLIDGRWFYYEKQTGKYWTSREMNSGCDFVMIGTPKKIYISNKTLLYCNHCKEYFTENQFEEI